jgi:cobalt-zinc-cadmium efflux system protein
VHSEHEHAHAVARPAPGDRARNRRRLTITLGLVAGYMAAEVVGGIVSGSLALLADAGHMLSDAASLGLALFALWIAQKPRTAVHTYGYFRTEILAALVNGATLVALSLFIFWEAYQRWQDPPDVRGGLMMVVAVGGLLINLAGLQILSGGRSESLNVHGAWLHVLADTLGSVQAIAAAALIWGLGWKWADPVASAVIGVLVVLSSWKLLKSAVMVLMESSPSHVDVDQIDVAMRAVADVQEIHDLHVWTISSGLVALSGHVVCSHGCDRDALLSAVGEVLEHRFGISHTTIQIEAAGSRECRPEF